MNPASRAECTVSKARKTPPLTALVFLVWRRFGEER